MHVAAQFAGQVRGRSEGAASDDLAPGLAEPDVHLIQGRRVSAGEVQSYLGMMGQELPKQRPTGIHVRLDLGRLLDSATTQPGSGHCIYAEDLAISVGAGQ